MCPDHSTRSIGLQGRRGGRTDLGTIEFGVFSRHFWADRSTTAARAERIALVLYVGQWVRDSYPVEAASIDADWDSNRQWHWGPPFLQ